MLASLYTPPHSVDRVSWYQTYEVYDDASDFSTLNYPVSLTNISKFENTNDISVNVYTVHEKIVNKSKKKPVEEVNDELPSECESDGYDSDELPPAKKRRCHKRPSVKKRRCQFLDDEA